MTSSDGAQFDPLVSLSRAAPTTLEFRGAGPNEVGDSQFLRVRWPIRKGLAGVHGLKSILLLLQSLTVGEK